MTLPALDDRARDVLASVIQLHIATGEPVGSESLSRALGRTVSPATLRTVMAELEKLGYLDQPHTSAGRMPTDEGYRFYVDHLLRRDPLPAQDAAAIDTELRGGREATPQDVMESASALLSRLSRNIGFVIVPDIGRTAFRHVDFVRLPHPRILVVMVASTGLITNKVVEMEEELSQDQLQACANYLNTHFAGMPLDRIRRRLLELMSEEKALYDRLLKDVVALSDRAFAETASRANLYLNGTANVLDQPEFDDVRRMRALFHTFEEKSRLVRILNACLGGDGVRIMIGHENPDPNLSGMAVVAAPWTVEGEAGCGIGVMGSTRMEYARVIGLVDHVARALSEALKDLRA